MSKSNNKIKDVTNMLFVKEGKILLGYKKRGFGMGKYNGFGGKPQGDETIVEAAIREAHEEAGLLIQRCHLVAIVDFGESYLLRMHVYIATEWMGQIVETDEMLPQWFNISEIPYSKMWKDDFYWLPLVLNGKKIKATFKFMNNDDTLGTADNDIIDYRIEERDFDNDSSAD
ncbi:MAG TPA: DNA mismatch repair protein MutT [Firmicutes bacterium]|jgi:8-oxo-dGTP pyrophosphatase MutT (NUDIX family)|nr:DNA mismatch repair protein MutT [Bacillota bacterium]